MKKLARLPLQTWNYTNEFIAIRHIGPVAQDFYAAFGVGADDKHIATIDADGVALAAIQGLNKKIDEDAAAKDAGAADAHRLGDGDPGAVRGRATRGGDAAGAGAEGDEIEVVLHEAGR